MVEPLKLHWAHSKPNFGDWLSPDICSLLSGRKVVHAPINDCTLVAVGSLLQRLKENFWNRRINVWGSGFIAQCPPRESRHYIHAVRGTFSAQQLKMPHLESTGDPGLLVDSLYAKVATKKHQLGIVPHYKDKANPVIKMIKDNVKNSLLIDVFNSPEEVCHSIQQCDYILSSSLHGLVVADSYGIPNLWLEVSEQVKGGGWKFRDYYSNFGMEVPTPLQPKGELKMDEIVSTIGYYQRNGIDHIKERLIKSFPFPKPA